VRVEGAAFALPAAAVLLGFAEGAAVAGVRALVLGVLVASLFAHEMGHAAAARAQGLPVLEVALTALGGVARIGRAPSRGSVPADEWVPALAGPATSLALAAVCWAARAATGAGGVPADLHALLFDPLAVGVAVNGLMGAVNLLPVLPADGGRVLRALLSHRMPPLVATRIAAGLSVAAGVALVALAAVLLHPIASPALVVVGALLAAVARREVALARLRRRHEVFREFVAANVGRFPALDSLPRDAEGFPVLDGDAPADPAVADALRAYEAAAGPGAPARPPRS
jgi:Zn-dependent protease